MICWLNADLCLMIYKCSMGVHKRNRTGRGVSQDRALGEAMSCRGELLPGPTRSSGVWILPGVCPNAKPEAGVEVLHWRVAWRAHRFLGTFHFPPWSSNSLREIPKDSCKCESWEQTREAIEAPRLGQVWFWLHVGGSSQGCCIYLFYVRT
jgi:hypothetical protein